MKFYNHVQVAKTTFESLKTDMEEVAGEFDSPEESNFFLRSSRCCAQAITILNVAERKITDKYDVVQDDE